jgi:RND family efflux transporter MFP subunit
MTIMTMTNPPKLSRFQKAAVAGATLAVVAGLGYGLFGRKKELKINFEAAKTERLPTFVDTAHCLSRPRPLAETYLTVQHGGRLEQLGRNVGQSVRRGEIIAVVDRTANAAALKSALSGYGLAQRDYARVSGLLAGGSVTREEFDGAASRLEIKRAELEQARQRVEDSVVRAPFDGVVSVVVFKPGDKVPDGGRIAAIDDPRGTQATCRLDADVAKALPKTQQTTWTLVDGGKKESFPAQATITVDEPQGGFIGLDREVHVETLAAQAKAVAGKLVDITLNLPAKQDVTRIDSLAVVRRQGKPYVLVRRAGGVLAWTPVEIVKQTPTETVAAGVPADGEILVLRDDLTAIEAYVVAARK